MPAAKFSSLLYLDGFHLFTWSDLWFPTLFTKSCWSTRARSSLIYDMSSEWPTSGVIFQTRQLIIMQPCREEPGTGPEKLSQVQLPSAWKSCRIWEKFFPAIVFFFVRNMGNPFCMFAELDLKTPRKWPLLSNEQFSNIIPLIFATQGVIKLKSMMFTIFNILNILNIPTNRTAKKSPHSVVQNSSRAMVWSGYSTRNVAPEQHSTSVWWLRGGRAPTLIG